VSVSNKVDAFTKSVSVVGSVDSETSGWGEVLCSVVGELCSVEAGSPELFESTKNNPAPKTVIAANTKE
jgi:hypothetical protein